MDYAEKDMDFDLYGYDVTITSYIYIYIYYWFCLRFPIDNDYRTWACLHWEVVNVCNERTGTLKLVHFMSNWSGWADGSYGTW